MPSAKCSNCDKVFSTQSNLKRHLKNPNRVCQPTGFSFETSLFKCLEGCEVSFKTSSDLRSHLSSLHKFELMENSMEFSNFQEFKTWLENEERANNLRFFKSRGVKRSVNGHSEKMYFHCSRTGKQRIVPEESRNRALKSQGSAKYNFACTSQILLTKDLESGKCYTSYYSTHYGHTEDIQHLRVSKQCRKEIALKLMMGVPSTCILDSIRDNMHQILNRDDILTRKDINNIKTAFNISINEGCRHPDDATSVYLWIQECLSSECNPVLFFKRQGEILPDFNLDYRDFCLILMNSTQIELFKKFSNSIICIDGTHGMNAYNFELTTVLVLDEYGEGFPVAFLFSNRKDTYIYEVFFSFIKKATFPDNMLVCNTFMSDVTNVYYNAWTVVMGVANHQLFCSWHIDRAWQQNLSKVSNLEKRQWVYKTLKYLQRSMQEEVFEKDFHEFLNILRTGEDTQNMYEYLKSHYYSNRSKWAYCFRKACGINTNMHLESMHKVLKYIYLEGKKIKRLDKALHALQKFVRDKTIDRIIKLTKGKCSEHLNKIKNRHRAATIKPYEYTIIEDGNIYEIADKDNDVKYVVTKVKDNICCELICQFCNICVHSYECGCLDYSIRSTICRHIHSIKMTIENSSMSSNHTETEIINENSKSEVTRLVNNLTKESEDSSSDTLLNNVKLEAQQLLRNINTLNYSTEEQQHLLRHLKTLNNLGSTSAVKEISNISMKSLSPSNKKIEKQRIYCTKKKNKVKKSIISKPDSKERKIIKETLSHSVIISDTSENDHTYC